MKYFRMMAMLALVIVIGVGMATSADAAFKLRLTDLSTLATVTIEDGDVNDDGILPGIIVYNSSLGNWLVTVTTGLSKPIIGGPAEACMDLNSVEVNSTTPAVLRVELTNTDFFLPPSPQYILKTDIGGTTDGTLLLQKRFDINNQEFGGPIVQTIGPFGPGAFSATQSTLVPGVVPFSMTDIVTITHNRNFQVTSFDAMNCVSVPEPSTLMLLGSGLLGIAGYARVKFGRKKKEA